jgi:hypothetical protein
MIYLGSQITSPFDLIINHILIVGKIEKQTLRLKYLHLSITINAMVYLDSYLDVLI